MECLGRKTRLVMVYVGNSVGSSALSYCSDEISAFNICKCARRVPALVLILVAGRVPQVLMRAGRGNGLPISTVTPSCRSMTNIIKHDAIEGHEGKLHYHDCLQCFF
jgi:hypothetical protein